MNKVRAYFDEVYDELVNKVTWPSWAELQESAIIVMIAATIFAIVVAAMDFIFQEGMAFVYSM
jgi:preprotein translocase subunit SecE